MTDHLVAAALLMSSALVFAGAFMLNYKTEASMPLALNIEFLMTISMVIYPTALVTAVITLYLEELSESYDPRKEQRRERDALMRDFHSIKD